MKSATHPNKGEAKHRRQVALLAKRLSERREELGLSMGDIEEATGVARNLVHRLENPDKAPKGPSAYEVARLASVLKVTSDWLLGRDTEEPIVWVWRIDYWQGAYDRNRVEFEDLPSGRIDMRTELVALAEMASEIKMKRVPMLASEWAKRSAA